ncbi:Mg2+ transporter MgtE [Acetomicrobium mobile DSM 13181]|uniref:Magnesium transporter MgtE n=1 Tax=Acetomicrobium mobile (strain ATCC BAA-54 / DSM 13181 / JCM 12221 / NGA) TaxID=891968 RepID=I4BX74_ACEMN|nr:magnesium transporter [Acetomicrobium mobile]AFM21881.1 Mg2+ transporter MgtE [Acetomicrobium mobile DSM 13181]
MEQRNIDFFRGTVEDMLEARNYEALRDYLSELHPYEIASLLEEFEEPEQITILSLTPPETAAEALEHLDYDDQYRLLDHSDKAVAKAILAAMGRDAIADLLMAIHPNKAQQIMAMVPEEDLESIKYLMTYPEDSAGGIMSLDYIQAREYWTIEQVIRHFRKVGQKQSIANYIYIVDAIGKLVGVLSLKELLLNDPKSLVSDVMHKNIITVLATADQEEAARIMSQYDLMILPVVNDQGRLVGVITADDIMDVIEEEDTEDIHRLGGSQPLELPYLESSLMTLFSKRIGWLVFLFVVQAVTSNILKYYENVLSSVVTLAFFIPLLADVGGNSGTQASSLIIRALALGEVTVKDIAVILFKELRVSGLIGIVMGFIGYFFAWAISGSATIGMIVACTLIVVLIMSSTIGAILPILGRMCRVDPAVFSAPFITTVVDITALTVYFNIAIRLLNID